MEHTWDTGDAGLRLIVRGRLTFADALHFPVIVRRFEEAKPKALQIDMSQTDFVDSAGIGMLLLLSDAAHRMAVPLIVSGAKGSVRDALVRVRFDQLVTVQG